ncbi:MAG: GNAT family N-acetyltransferase [Acidobacteriota bacterium]|nr:GNAT family N-acetyltransferase [Acidobacteriota bacterium]
MAPLPTLTTARLTLRPFAASDAPAVQEFCSAREVALNTLMIPHPYPDGAAMEWIEMQKREIEAGTIHNFALVDGEQLVGAMGLMMKEHAIAELGYWIGVPFWNRGYASEAGRELVRYGFEECGLHRIFAYHFTRNPASGRVLQKIGMQREGFLRQHQYKWGEYLDVVFYGLLREDLAVERVSRDRSVVVE